MKREKGSTVSNHLRQHIITILFNIQSFFSVGSLEQDHRHCILHGLLRTCLSEKSFYYFTICSSSD